MFKERAKRNPNINVQERAKRNPSLNVQEKHEAPSNVYSCVQSELSC